MFTQPGQLLAKQFGGIHLVFGPEWSESHKFAPVRQTGFSVVPVSPDRLAVTHAGVDGYIQPGHAFTGLLAVAGATLDHAYSSQLHCGIVVQVLNGRPVLRQGACRIRAAAMANIELAEEGRELISLIRCEEFRGSRASAEQFTLDGNSNLALSVVAEALSIKRMVEDAEEPKTFAELAKRRGKTEQHLRQMVRVLDLPEALQVMLVTGEVSMYVALDEYLYSGDKAVNNITKAIDVYGKATAKTLKFVKAGNIDAAMQPKAPVVQETNANTPETTVTEQTSVEGTTDETTPPQLVDGNVGTNPEPTPENTPEPKAKDPIKTPEPKTVSVSSVLNKKTVTTIADTAIPLFSRIAEEAEQRAAKNLSDDTYTLVLTNDEMNAICEAHGNLTQYLRKHAEKQQQGQA